MADNGKNQGQELGKAQRLASVYVQEDGALFLRVERKMSNGAVRSMLRELVDQVDESITNAKIARYVEHVLKERGNGKAEIMYRHPVRRPQS